MLRAAIVAIAVCPLAGWPASPAKEARTSAAAIELNIPSQDLGSALSELARLADAEIFLPNDPIVRWRSVGVRGRMTPNEALDQLLRCTPFDGTVTADGIISIRRHDRRPLMTMPEDDDALCEGESNVPPRVAILMGSSVG